ncbi:MAG: DUF2971 domain-containing protein [Brevundimonas sp.]|uniref:DUF2971 domain-containing protein n=1 Tax=Brevundimonas sp. TaxID=1871086 RepID=UPI003919B473
MLTEPELFEIFHQRAALRIAQARNQGQRFAYYTNGATAKDILANSEIWLRSPSCMNDFSEVRHGYDMFIRNWSSPKGIGLRATLQTIHPGTADRLFNHITSNSLRQLFAETFIACVSEHDAKDDEHGRLSMWRAYAAQTGIAMVFSGEIFAVEDDGFGAYYSPVEYMSEIEFSDEFEKLANRLLANVDELKRLSPDDFFTCIYHAALMAMLCVKHPGFREEREWRIFSIDPTNLGLLTRSIEVVGGVPQPVLKLPMVTQAQGRSALDKLERLLIGPTQYPVAVRSAMLELLTQKGVNNPSAVVHLTGIPLRQNS